MPRKITKTPFERALDVINAEKQKDVAQTTAELAAQIASGRPRFEVVADEPPEPEIDVQSVEVTVTTAVPEVAAPVIALPEGEELAQLVLMLKGQLDAQAKEIDGLRARAPAKVEYEEDMTDQLLFLARPNGEQWEDRIVVDKKTVRIEGTQTAFFGPFDNETQITTYLTEKLRKRPDAAMEWGNVRPMKGHEARALRRREMDERKKQYGGSPAMNILDRRMRPVLDELTGSMDRTGGVGVAILARN